MGDEHRRLALRRARFEVICETIARLRARMGGHTLPFAGATSMTASCGAGPDVALRLVERRQPLAEMLSRKLTADAAAAAASQV
jgi:hypothetical protein